MSKKKPEGAFQLACMVNQLAKALDAAGTVTDSGLKVPIIKTTRIEVKGGQASIIATNTDRAVHTHIAADGEGVVHLDTEALTLKVRALKPTAPVSIEGDEKAVTITQGRTKWKLPAIINGDQFDFEAAAAPLEGNAIQVEAPQLIAAALAVQPAFATDDRWFMTGAYFDFTGGKLVAVGTDGQLLHAVGFPGDWVAMDGLLIPPESISAIARLFASAETLELVATKDAFTLSDGETLFRSKMIEGTFPPWRRVVPKDAPNSVHADCGELIATLERVAAIRDIKGTKGNRYVPVTITFGEKEIGLASANRDGEVGEDGCPCELIGAERQVIVNVGNLLTALKSFGEVDTIVIEYPDNLGQVDPPVPFLVRRAVSEVEDFRLVSPLRG